MLCITDANIWIDLDVARLVRHVFALAITWATPDIILEELNTVDVDWLLRQGVKSHPLSSAQIERTAALREGVVVHGILWLLDRMIEETAIDASTAVVGLQRMLDHGARLPRPDVDERLRRWRDT